MPEREGYHAWDRRFRHAPTYEEWIAHCHKRAAPGEAAAHAEHMLHAQLLAEGMGRWMAKALGNRRRELLRVLHARAGLPIAKPFPFDR